MLRLEKPKSFKDIRKVYLFCVLAIAFCMATESFAIVRYESIEWTRNYNEIHQPTTYPISYQEKTINITKSKLLKRQSRSKVKKTIEPLNIYVKRNGSDLFRHAEFFALRGHIHSLARLFKKAHPDAVPLRGDHEKVAMTLTDEMMRHIDLSKLLKRFKQKHYNLTLESTSLKASPFHYENFFSEISPFLRDRQINIARKKIERGEKVSFNEYFLTDFARKMVGKYILYRGPNCFHASLAFHHLQFARSPLLNINEEKNHHKAMVNYDELWRTLQKFFYEVSPRKSKLKYGDVLVFFDIDGDIVSEPYFRDIRHASVYLLNNFTFSKGSKSPNTPYSIKKLKDEWRTWDKYTKKLGLRVFRRKANFKPTSASKPTTDWLY